MYTTTELELLEQQQEEKLEELKRQEKKASVPHYNAVNKANNLIDCTTYKEVGSGAFGYVVKCKGYDQYVVKYIKKAKNIHTNNVKAAVKRHEVALIRERDLMLTLNNAHIVNVYDKKVKLSKWDIDPEYAYMVLEYCNSGDLRNMIRGKYNISYDTILNKFVYGIGNALQYIHEQNIIHHDLKPENVFVNSDKNNITLKLGDFGLYSKIDNSYKSSIEGTDFYLPWYQLVSTEKAQITNIYYNSNPIQFVNTNRAYVPVAKYFIDWYAYVCIIYEIITTKKLNVNSPGNNLIVFNTCCIDIDSISDITLRNILMNIMCIDITVYFTGIDDLSNEHYKKIFELLATQEYIHESIINKKDIKKDGKKALEYDSGNKKYKLTLPRNNKKIIISSPEQIMTKLYSSENKNNEDPIVHNEFNEPMKINIRSKNNRKRILSLSRILTKKNNKPNSSYA